MGSLLFLLSCEQMLQSSTLFSKTSFESVDCSGVGRRTGGGVGIPVEVNFGDRKEIEWSDNFRLVSTLTVKIQCD